jgi:hypothetical protein
MLQAGKARGIYDLPVNEGSEATAFSKELWTNCTGKRELGS